MFPIKSSRVTLVGGGPVSPADLQEILTFSPYLVAADGGADTVLAAGRTPDVVIGDLDSISLDARQRIDSRHIVYDPSQDTTDFEKCLGRIDSPLILGLGFLGARIDHELAALAVLARSTPGRIVLIGAEDICFHAPPALALDLPVGMRFSLFPMAPVRGRSSGLEWPIDALEFVPAGQCGTSNRVTGPVRVAMDGPGMLVILPRRALNPVLDVLPG
ncbi:thiamine diphosphokinase [Oceaniovalibus sp. ACAM 378]|uniref:thiamine diphosphokinase n=1 Tax=Oceaniovalibus sp. ACAM 378 TaxID=2599923 RepID=UPI0011D5B449|nr:thiamine diphosphokinase [Oceaniovalibus sp. ACAM 378]TYB91016.1 thiamine diphosphokinase [Oceaniovalibus sp. ACAM 378]